MKRLQRCHPRDLTSHELVVLAFYRSLPLAEQRAIDGLLGRWWRLPTVQERFRIEAPILGVGCLPASSIEVFIEASVDVIGVQRRAA